MYLNSIIYFLRKEEAKANCETIEQKLTECMKQLKVTEDSRQPFFSRKKEIQGHFMKFQNRQSAYDKMRKDLEFTQSEFKREKEKSTTYINQYLVCL